MNHTVIKKLPTPEEITQSYPLSKTARDNIRRDRKEVTDILAGRDKRKIIIVGPCSAWPNTAVLDYARRLATLNKKLGKQLKIIMRVYIQKPRTQKGWTGPVNQPDPLSKPDIVAGINYTRKMMVDVIELGLPIADEALFTHNAKGFLELLSWVAIGARSTEDQEHRIFASGIDCPVGLKNPTHGSLNIAINSVITAQHSHVAALDGYEIETKGNQYAHVVLRGGADGPNYSINHLESLKQLIDKNTIQNPAVIIDASHDNCLINGKKDHTLQKDIILKTLKTLREHTELDNLVKGFMIESFIKKGNQNVNSLDPDQIDLQGLSITDPCLGWEETESLLLQIASEIHQYAT